MKTKPIASFCSDQGGSCNFYTIKGVKDIAFKEFGSKEDAKFAYSVQKKLSKLGLAPKVYGKIRRISIDGWHESTGYGFLTQKVKTSIRLSRKKIQSLVDKIYSKTKLRFWDSHHYNIGIHRNKYLCIDTGKESFNENCNAWGNYNPGPLCKECLKYRCTC